MFSGKGVYGFLTGSKGQALRVFEKIFLFPLVPHGERIFPKNLDSPKTYTMIALKQ